jgi:hypothetical protein
VLAGVVARDDPTDDESALARRRHHRRRRPATARRQGDQSRRSGETALEPSVERLLEALGLLLPGLAQHTLRLRLGILIGTVIAFLDRTVRLGAAEASQEREELLSFAAAGLVGDIA